MTRDHPYDWTRWWAPEDQREHKGLLEATSLEGDFLPDPDSILGRALHPSLQTLQKLQHVPALILVGEAGSGKSWDVWREHHRLLEEGVRSVLVDLRTVTESDLVDATLGETDLATTLDSGPEAVLWVDSLDEAPTDLARVAGVLTRALEGLSDPHRERLRLRLVCRSTVWPAIRDLQHSLAKLWPGDGTRRLTLLALSRRDVEAAARAESLDSEAFLLEVHKRSLEALAAWPLTLCLLLVEFSENQARLSLDRVALYEQACQRLCAENQREPRPARERSDAERLAIAELIAAVTLLSGRAGISRSLGRKGGERWMPAAELEGRKVTLRQGDGGFRIQERDLDETLAVSGLFLENRGQYAFVHRSYAEFLAAQYLSRHNLLSTQIRQLLAGPGSHEAPIPPQLYGTATWLAQLRKDVFEWLLEAQPELLMQAESGRAGTELRSRLVARLMDMYVQGELLPWHGSGGRWPRGLCHEDLAVQLRSFLAGEAPEPARFAAIRIAGVCEVKALEDDLLALALDANCSPDLRTAAVWAIGQMSPSERLAALSPLLDVDPDQDPDEDIRGAVLAALWPDHLSVSELLPRLTPHRRDHHSGTTYWQFLTFGVTRHLAPTDLPAVLRWLEERAGEPTGDPWFEELEGSILARAWALREHDEVIQQLARVLLARETYYEKTLRWLAPEGWPAEQDHDRRRLLAAAIRYAAGLPGTTERAVWRLADHIQRERDIPWALAELDRAPSPHEARLWAEVVRLAFPREPSAGVGFELSSKTSRA
jgi:hypothetical protein